MKTILLYRFFAITLMIIFSTASFMLVESDVDYLIGVGASFLGVIAFLLLSNKGMLYIDIGWIICFIVTLVYIVLAFFEEKSTTVIGVQSLTFILPLSMYISRISSFEITQEGLADFLLLLCISHIPAFTISADQVYIALTSVAERARFHTYTSISITFLLLSCLLYLEVRAFKKIVLFFALAFFSVTAEHRSLYVALVAQIIFWVMTGNRIRNPVILRGIMYASIGFICVLFFTDLGSKIILIFGRAIEGSDGNANLRMELADLLLADIGNNAFGFGFGDFYKYGVDAKNENVYYGLHHNSFLTTFYFLGVIPGLGFLFSMVMIAARYRHSDKVTSALQSALVGMCCFALFNLWFEHAVYGLSFWLLFGVYSGRIRGY